MRSGQPPLNLRLMAAVLLTVLIAGYSMAITVQE
jgi:hypothetical protein